MAFLLEKIFNLVIHRKWSLGRGPFAPGGVRRILVVRNDNVGDVLCSTPAIRSLRRAFPGAFLAGLVVRYSQDALQGNPDLDRVFIYEKAKHRPERNRLISLYAQFKVLKELKGMGFDLAIGLRSAFSWSEAWLVYFTGAPFRLGYPPAKKGDLGYRFFYNLTAGPEGAEGHEVERVLRLVGSIGVAPWEERLIVSVPEAEREEGAAFLKRNRIAEEKLIGFHLSSRQAANRWPPGKFAELAGRLLRENYPVVLTWAPQDREIAEEVLSLAGPGVFLFPTPTLRHLGAIQERCRIFVSPDGGAMHFAAAVGTPTVGLFGETDPSDWGPWGQGHVALRNGPQASSIPVEEVYACVQKLLDVKKNKS